MSRTGTLSLTAQVTNNVNKHAKKKGYQMYDIISVHDMGVVRSFHYLKSICRIGNSRLVSYSTLN